MISQFLPHFWRENSNRNHFNVNWILVFLAGNFKSSKIYVELASLALFKNELGTNYQSILSFLARKFKKEHFQRKLDFVIFGGEIQTFKNLCSARFARVIQKWTWNCLIYCWTSQFSQVFWRKNSNKEMFNYRVSQHVLDKNF